ncbi:MAG TPA: cell division protein ZapE, partial [Stellaceae bacterium]|nr:cell division protein ZapE [Stellaceae bacterium]
MTPPPIADEDAIAEGPLALFHARLSAGEISADTQQARAAQRLQQLWDELQHYQPQAGGGFLTRLGFGKPAAPPPKGLYIYGRVGRGKSMLMDAFFATVPGTKKRRVHFFAFMADVHARIHARRAEKGDPIVPVAQDLANEATLLCFDEFHVVDIADAMILGRLFAALFAAGVVVVATSNREPDRLYEGGLQRERFLPFIDLLKERLDVIELDGPRDYRLQRFKGRQVYFTPPDAKAKVALAQAFADLTDGATPERETLTVLGRELEVPRAAKNVAWFTFEELCMKALGPNDYLALVGRYHTFILDGIPTLNFERRNEAKRFNIFIDTLYDAHGNLVCSAEAPPQELYTEGDGSFEFQRTVSRLIEMQSDDY